MSVFQAPCSRFHISPLCLLLPFHAKHQHKHSWSVYCWYIWMKLIWRFIINCSWEVWRVFRTGTLAVDGVDRHKNQRGNEHSCEKSSWSLYHILVLRKPRFLKNLWVLVLCWEKDLRPFLISLSIETFRYQNSEAGLAKETTSKRYLLMQAAPSPHLHIPMPNSGPRTWTVLLYIYIELPLN